MVGKEGVVAKVKTERADGEEGGSGEQAESWAGGLHRVGASLLCPDCRLEVYSPAPGVVEEYHSRVPSENGTEVPQKYHRNLFCPVMEAGSPRSRCRQVWFLPRLLSLACRLS